MTPVLGALPDFSIWEIWAGDTATLAFQFVGDDDVPVNLTGRSVRLRLTHVVGTTATSTTLVSGTDPEIVIADQAVLATRGHVTITLVAARTEAWPRNASSFVFEVALLTAGLVETEFAGDLVVKGRPA